VPFEPGVAGLLPGLGVPEKLLEGAIETTDHRSLAVEGPASVSESVVEKLRISGRMFCRVTVTLVVDAAQVRTRRCCPGVVTSD
jgi:hypothetical protein